LPPSSASSSPLEAVKREEKLRAFRSNLASLTDQLKDPPGNHPQSAERSKGQRQLSATTDIGKIENKNLNHNNDVYPWYYTPRLVHRSYSFFNPTVGSVYVLEPNQNHHHHHHRNHHNDHNNNLLEDLEYSFSQYVFIPVQHRMVVTTKVTQHHHTSKHHQGGHEHSSLHNNKTILNEYNYSYLAYTLAPSSLSQKWTSDLSVHRLNVQAQYGMTYRKKGKK
jgi:hypothetical protein